MCSNHKRMWLYNQIRLHIIMSWKHCLPQKQIVCRVLFGGGGGGGGGLDHKCLPLEFEKAKLLDMSSTSVKPQETLVVSVGKHDITKSKNRHL